MLRPHRLILSLFVFALLIVASAQPLWAEVTYVYSHVYTWRGADNSGNGDTNTWNNWLGNVKIEGDGVHPPVVTTLAPDDGDALRFITLRDPANHPFEISVGDIDLPSSGVNIAIGGTFSGGRFNVKDISVQTAGPDNPPPFSPGMWPLTFNGTTLQGKTVSIADNRSQINFSAASIVGDTVTLGAYYDPALPVYGGARPTINLATTLVKGVKDDGSGVVNLVSNDGVLNMTGGSVLLADRLVVGPTAPGSGEMTLELKGDTGSFISSPLASIAPIAAGVVRLNVHGAAPAFGPSSNVNIGESGHAYVTVDQNGSLNTATTFAALFGTGAADINLDFGTWTTKDLYLGGLGKATFMADNVSTVTSERVVIGGLASANTSTATLDHASTWTISEQLTVGGAGSGQLNIKHDSEVDVTQEVVLGDEQHASGTIEITGGAEAFQAHTTFEVGRNGIGTLNINAGGHVESDGVMTLGAHEKGVGQIVIDGSGSELHTTDKLYVGYGDTGMMGTGTGNGAGTITVRNGGVITADEDVVLGENGKSSGILNISGANSKLQLGAAAHLTIGQEGTGELNLSSAATFTSDGDVSLGESENSTGNVSVDGENSKWNVAGSLKIGENGKGKVEIRNKGNVSATGTAMVLGEQDKGDGTLILDGDGTSLDFSGELKVGDSGKGTVTLQNGADYTTANLTLGNAAESEGTLEVMGSTDTTFVATGNLIAGKSGRGIVSVAAGGKLTINGDATLGEQAGSGSEAMPTHATITGTDTVWAVHGTMTVGKAANTYAVVDLTDKGSLVTSGIKLDVGVEENSNGIVNVSGTTSHQGPNDASLVVNGLMRVGVSGNGTLNVSGGALARVHGDLSVGVDVHGYGVVNVSDSDTDLAIDDDILIGGLGIGEVEVSHGAILKSDSPAGKIIVDSGVPNGASLTIADSNDESHYSLVQAGNITIGKNGYGSLVVRDLGTIGESIFPVALRVATENGSHGEIFGDGKAKIGVEQLEAGFGGEAEIELIGKAHIDCFGDATLGSAAETGSVDLKLTNGNLTAQDIVALGKSTTTISLSGQMLLRAGGSLSMGGSSANPAILNIQTTGELMPDAGATDTKLFAGTRGKTTITVDSGGKIHDLAEIFIGQGAGTQVTVSGADSYINAGTITVVGGGTLTADAGSLITSTNSDNSSMTINGGDVVVKNGASLFVQGWLNIQSGSAVFSAGGEGDIAQRVDVRGSLDVRGGKMRIGASLGSPAAPVGTILVLPGGVLQGFSSVVGGLATIRGNVNVSGDMVVGHSPGLLTVEGDVNLQPGGVLHMEIGGATPGTQYDQLIATGVVTTNGMLDLAIVNSGSGFQLPSVGDQYTLLSSTGGVSGTFQNSAALRTVAGGWLVDWSLTSNATSAVLKAVSITPILDGDYNGNGAVDAADYAVWRKTIGGINLAADGNRDGVVNDLDLGVWRSHFGQMAGGGAGVSASDPPSRAVPEPTALALLGIATVAMAASRRRRLPRSFAGGRAPDGAA